MPNGRQWYVLQVPTGKEAEIKKAIEKRNIKAVVPIGERLIRRGGKWRTEQYVIFSGYVFVRLRYDFGKFYAISEINKNIRILGGGYNPTPLDAEELNTIMYLSKCLSSLSYVSFNEQNDLIYIKGPLADLKNKIVKIDRRQKKATISIKIAHKNKEIKLSYIESGEDIQCDENTAQHIEKIIA